MIDDRYATNYSPAGGGVGRLSCSGVVCFFFSSRRRHTIFDCDWSSDVCSSDLVRWVDAENMSYEETAELLENVDGVLVPGGFGSRGWEGKILACRAARERRIPYLGICLGMHVAVSEFARHVVGLDGANSTEMDPETPYPVIDLLPEQKGIEDLGGTMRLGAQAVEVAEGTQARELYGDAVIFERHRHRYEVNKHYREQLVGSRLLVNRQLDRARLV